MTPAEWQEIVEATDARWPGHWTPQQAVAYYQDLREFEPVDVWAAWHRLNDSGREFPPNGSLLRSKAIDERRETAKRELWARPALGTSERVVAWKTYATATYGEPIELWEAARREHETWNNCKSPLCDIHDNQRVNLKYGFKIIQHREAKSGT